MKRFEKWKRKTVEDTDIRLAKIPATQIGFLNSLVESYEGMGILRTRDPKMGIVEFWIIPDFKEEFWNFIGKIEEEIPIIWLPKSSEENVYGIANGIGYDPEQPGEKTIQVTSKKKAKKDSKR